MLYIFNKCLIMFNKKYFIKLNALQSDKSFLEICPTSLKGVVTYTKLSFLYRVAKSLIKKCEEHLCLYDRQKTPNCYITTQSPQT